MTKSQSVVVELLKSKFLEKHYGSTFESYEFKRFEIKEETWTKYNGRKRTIVFVILESGIKNDEKTLASVLCRDYRFVVVEPKGAVKLMNGRKRKNGWFAVYHELTR
jgi:hypothetical protein